MWTLTLSPSQSDDTALFWPQMPHVSKSEPDVLKGHLINIWVESKFHLKCSDSVASKTALLEKVRERVKLKAVKDTCLQSRVSLKGCPNGSHVFTWQLDQNVEVVWKVIKLWLSIEFSLKCTFLVWGMNYVIKKLTWQQRLGFSPLHTPGLFDLTLHLPPVMLLQEDHGQHLPPLSPWEGTHGI